MLNISPTCLWGTYAWGPRRETLASLGSRAYINLKLLAKEHSALRRWRNSLNDRPIAIDQHALASALSKGRIKYDDNDAIIKELGYSLDINTEIVSASYLELHFSVGVWTRSVENTCVFEMITSQDRKALCASRQLLEGMCGAIIKAWSPSFGYVTTHELYNKIKQPPISLPQAGWFTFLSNEYTDQVRGRIPAQIVEIKGIGLLLITCESFSELNSSVGVRALQRLATWISKTLTIRNGPSA